MLKEKQDSKLKNRKLKTPILEWAANVVALRMAFGIDGPIAFKSGRIAKAVMRRAEQIFSKLEATDANR